MKYFERVCCAFNAFILFLLLVVCFSMYFINKTWGMVDLTQVLFFTRVNCGGANIGIGCKLLFFCVIIPLGLTVGLLWLFKRFRKDNLSFFPKSMVLVWAIGVVFIARANYDFSLKELSVLCCVLFSFYLVNLRRNFSPFNIFGLLLLLWFFVFMYLYAQNSMVFMWRKLEYTDFYAKNYVKPQNLTNEKKRNVIVVFVESLDEKLREYVDKNEHLVINDTDAVRFDRFIEGYAQRWTQAALFSSFTGTHIHYISDYHRYLAEHFIRYKGHPYGVPESEITNGVAQEFDFDTPRIASLSKIGKQDGFQNLFVQGGNLDFSGTRSFLLKNGFDSDNVYGVRELRNILGKEPTEDEKLGLGTRFSDEDVFAVFKNKISEFNPSKPFLAVMFTLELHVRLKNDEETLAKFQKQTIQQLNEFILWYKQQDFYENTTLIIIGDHNRMGSNVVTGGKIYNAFFNLPETLLKDLNLHRTFNQIDMFPTILNIMGYDVLGGKAGVGVSLFAKNKTIAERFSYEKQNEIFRKLDKFYFDLWQNDNRQKEDKLSFLNEMLPKERLIAHAGGKINDDIYTNSREALEASYKRGYKYIELDLRSLNNTGGGIIAVHDAEQTAKLWNSYAADGSKNKKILEKYSLLFDEDILSFFNEHPDLWLVTDKIDDFQLLDERLGVLKKRMIVEVFSPEKYEEAKQLGFEHLAYCICSYSGFQFVRDNKVKMITISLQGLRTYASEIQKLRDRGVWVLAYAAKDKRELKKYENMADMFYYDGEESLD